MNKLSLAAAALAMSACAAHQGVRCPEGEKAYVSPEPKVVVFKSPSVNSVEEAYPIPEPAQGEFTSASGNPVEETLKFVRKQCRDNAEWLVTSHCQKPEGKKEGEVWGFIYKLDSLNCDNAYVDTNENPSGAKTYEEAKAIFQKEMEACMKKNGTYSLKIFPRI